MAITLVAAGRVVKSAYRRGGIAPAQVNNIKPTQKISVYFPQAQEVAALIGHVITEVGLIQCTINPVSFQNITGGSTYSDLRNVVGANTNAIGGLG